jgi:hypothetical protein
MMNDANDIEKALWANFDAGTDLGKGKLNRNKKDTEGGKSNRKDYRAKVDLLLQLGQWNQAGEDGVLKCATKAGAVARMIADAQNENNCTLEIFNLACNIIAKCQAIDAQTNAQAQGIIC